MLAAEDLQLVRSTRISISLDARRRSRNRIGANARPKARYTNDDKGQNSSQFEGERARRLPGRLGANLQAAAMTGFSYPTRLDSYGGISVLAVRTG